VRFHEATHFPADDTGTFAPVLQRRILRLFQRRGLLDEHTVDHMLTWQGTGGFSVDAAVRIHGSDRAGRERLIRYCARPPFALDRLRIDREPGARDRSAGAGDAEPSGNGSTPRTPAPSAHALATGARLSRAEQRCMARFTEAQSRASRCGPHHLNPACTRRF
jgi:hypothetical protein